MPNCRNCGAYVEYYNGLCNMCYSKSKRKKKHTVRTKKWRIQTPINISKNNLITKANIIPEIQNVGNNTKDEWAIVLDYLPQGHPMQLRSHPVAQIIGAENFNLLEVIPRDGKILKSKDIVYIGEGKREDIQSIIGKIPFNKLTANASSRLPLVINNIVRSKEPYFVDIINNAGSYNIKSHSLDCLELLHTQREKILSERKIANFVSFNDIYQKTGIRIESYLIRHLIHKLRDDAKRYLLDLVEQKIDKWGFTKCVLCGRIKNSQNMGKSTRPMCGNCIGGRENKMNQTMNVLNKIKTNNTHKVRRNPFKRVKVQRETFKGTKKLSPEAADNFSPIQKKIDKLRNELFKEY